MKNPRAMADRSYISTADIEQARTLWKQGVMVARHTGDFYRTELYQLHDFYLEVVWHTHFNVVIRVTRFSDTERLEPYLSQISLEDLFD